MVGYILLVLLALSAAGYFYGRNRAIASVQGHQRQLHSRPNYHGAFIAAWIGIPSILLVLIWLALQGPVIDTLLLWSLPPSVTEGLDKGQTGLLLSEIRSVAAGNIFGEPSEAVREAVHQAGRQGRCRRPRRGVARPAGVRAPPDRVAASKSRPDSCRGVDHVLADEHLSCRA